MTILTGMKAAIALGLWPKSWDDWLRQTWRFCACFLPHWILAPLLLVTVVTFFHELGHAAVALGLGGKVYNFVFLPGSQNLGHMQWDRPAGAPALFDDLVTGGPYFMWAAFAGTTALIAALPNKLHWSFASSLFCWGYFVPLADIAYNLYGGTGDLAVGGIEGLILLTVGTGLLGASYLLGFWVQRRLFGEHAVDLLGYVVSSIVIGGAFGIAALIGLALFS